MTDRDEIADLADRSRAMSEFQFGIEFAALTDAEREEFMALLEQRTAHGVEKLEAIEANVRAAKALLVLQVEKAPGMTLAEAVGAGRISIKDTIEAIRSAV